MCMVLSVQFGPLYFFDLWTLLFCERRGRLVFWLAYCPTVLRPGLVVVRGGTAIVPPRHTVIVFLEGSRWDSVPWLH